RCGACRQPRGHSAHGDRRGVGSGHAEGARDSRQVCSIVLLYKTMAVRPLLKMGDPLLLQVADPVTEFDSPELHALLADMRDTMEAMSGAGIAAPQIGVSKQVTIFGVTKNRRYPDAEE